MSQARRIGLPWACLARAHSRIPRAYNPTRHGVSRISGSSASPSSDAPILFFLYSACVPRGCSHLSGMLFPTCDNVQYLVHPAFCYLNSEVWPGWAQWGHPVIGEDNRHARELHRLINTVGRGAEPSRTKHEFAVVHLD